MNTTYLTMNTTYPAEVNRSRGLALPAVAFVLVIVSTAGALAGAQSPPIITQPRNEAHAAQPAAASSEQEASQRRRQLELMQAPAVNPGLVLTLGDVRFTSGRAELKAVAISNLNKLVHFLAKYRDHDVAIQGYTDSVGNEEHNQELSERRANSVKAYLVAQGIDPTRLFASGMGQSNPVAGNDSWAGRQQNRRAELVIRNPPAASSQRPRTTKMIVLLMLLESVSGHSGRPFL